MTQASGTFTLLAAENRKKARDMQRRVTLATAVTASSGSRVAGSPQRAQDDVFAAEQNRQRRRKPGSSHTSMDQSSRLLSLKFVFIESSGSYSFRSCCTFIVWRSTSTLRYPPWQYRFATVYLECHISPASRSAFQARRLSSAFIAIRSPFVVWSSSGLGDSIHAVCFKQFLREGWKRFFC